jgi:hypothetical protein
VRDTISFHNRGAGFTANSGLNVHFYNDTSFGNNLANYVGGSTTILRNDISSSGAVLLFGSDQANNTWNLGISDVRFASTDPSQAAFLSLAAGSPAIGAGIDVGLPFTGSAPDLGALPHQELYAGLISPVSVPLNVLEATTPVAPSSVKVTATR